MTTVTAAAEGEAALEMAAETATVGGGMSGEHAAVTAAAVLPPSAASSAVTASSATCHGARPVQPPVQLLSLRRGLTLPEEGRRPLPGIRPKQSVASSSGWTQLSRMLREVEAARHDHRPDESPQCPW